MVKPCGSMIKIEDYMGYHEVLGFNFVNTKESPTTMMVIIMSTISSSEFSPLNRSAIPNAHTTNIIIGNKYFIMKTQVFPTLKVENSFNTGMTFSTP